MTIRDKDVFMAKLWDWGVFNDCFSPTKITISDIDGVIERHNHFLFIETKSSGEELTTGQRILLEHLAARPNIHVMVLWGHPGKPSAYQFLLRDPKPVPCNMEHLKGVLKRWFVYANGDAPLIMIYAKEAQREFERLAPPEFEAISPVVIHADKKQGAA